MYTVTGKLTVYFEEPFWVGLYELITDGQLQVSRVVFGPEPKDYEVYTHFLTNWSKLYFSPPIAENSEIKRKINPKRMQRAISNQLNDTGIGTKAQQALKLQQEQSKSERKTYNRQKTEEELAHQFELRQQKKKEKHKGR